MMIIKVGHSSALGALTFSFLSPSFSDPYAASAIYDTAYTSINTYTVIYSTIRTFQGGKHDCDFYLYSVGLCGSSSWDGDVSYTQISTGIFS